VTGVQTCALPICLETADFLLAQGSRVTVVEMLPDSPVSSATAPGYQLHRRLEAGGCRLLLGSRVVEVLPQAVRVESQGRESIISPVDQVVLAAGFKARAPLGDSLSAAGIPHQVVGDAQEPRDFLAATGEGAAAAWRL
jgi:pyruvate/2-oxoglutarate dehydrogenase complex dihydrolipoamide dehydrogenase (E3) component